MESKQFVTDRAIAMNATLSRSPCGSIKISSHTVYYTEALLLTGLIKPLGGPNQSGEGDQTDERTGE